MRRPWIALGSVSGAASLVLLATAANTETLVFAWALTQLTFNILLAGLNPVVADQVPPSQLGRVTALVSLTTQLGVVSGAFLVQALLPNLTAALLVPALLCLVGSGILLRVLPDRHLARAELPPLTWRTWLGAYWISPRRAPDFAWAWLSRFLVGFGNVTLNSYQTYFLMDRFGYDEDTIGSVVFKVLLVNAVCMVVAGVVFGALSDRLRRRKPFVLLSAVVLALAHVMAAFAPSLGWYLAASAVSRHRHRLLSGRRSRPGHGGAAFTRRYRQGHERLPPRPGAPAIAGPGRGPALPRHRRRRRQLRGLLPRRSGHRPHRGRMQPARQIRPVTALP